MPKLLFIAFNQASSIRILSPPSFTVSVQYRPAVTVHTQAPEPVWILGAADNAIKSAFKRAALLTNVRDAEIIRQLKSGRFRVRQNDLRERKGMHGANKSPPTGVNPQRVQAAFQFARTFIVVRDARNAPRIVYIFTQEPRQLDCQCFCFTATRPGQDYAVAG